MEKETPAEAAQKDAEVRKVAKMGPKELDHVLPAIISAMISEESIAARRTMLVAKQEQFEMSPITHEIAKALCELPATENGKATAFMYLDQAKPKPAKEVKKMIF